MPETRVHLVNPSDLAFGISFITPRWMYVLASATPKSYGDLVIWDEVLEQVNPEKIRPGDIVGIGIQTMNAHRGYQVGRMARERGAYVVYGGFHATMFPEEPFECGGAHAVVSGEADDIWKDVLADFAAGRPRRLYEAGRLPGGQFAAARWDLVPRDKYLWASVQTMRGCPNHCSFCSVWRIDGQAARMRPAAAVFDELVEARRRGFRFVLLADDNFYGVNLRDLELARRHDGKRLAEFEAIRAQRLDLMERMARLPDDMIFFTQITMDAAEDPEFLKAMYKARIRGAGIGIEAISPDGLKAVYKDFNPSGAKLVDGLRRFREHEVSVLGAFMFGLPSDHPETFAATAELAQDAGVAIAQFTIWTPLPGSVDFEQWAKKQQGIEVGGIPISKYWLAPYGSRPKVYMGHPTMTAEEIWRGTRIAWERFYSLGAIWKRAHCARKLRSRLAFVLASTLLHQMYLKPIAAPNRERRNRARTLARLLAKPCQMLFRAPEMPDLHHS